MAWVWGSNAKGELGLGDYTTRLAPFPLVGLQERGIGHIEVGHQFSIGFTKSLKENIRESDIALLKRSMSREDPHMMNIGISATMKVEKSLESTSEGGRETIERTISVQSHTES